MQYNFENNGKKPPTKAKIIKKKKLKTLVTMTSSMMFINIFIWRLYFIAKQLEKRKKIQKVTEIVLKRHKLIF